MDQPGTMTVGTSNTVTINALGQNARLAFSGTAGQQVNVQVSNSTFTGGCWSLILSILKPDGTVLNSANTCGSGDVDLSFVTLPVTGTYTALVDPQGVGTGSVLVTLSMDQIGPISVNTSQTITINTPGQNAQLTFSGTVDQQVNIQVTNSTLTGGCWSLTLKLLKPDGTVLNSASACGSGNVSLSSIVLPVTGTYTVVIDPQGGRLGSVLLTLSGS